MSRFLKKLTSFWSKQPKNDDLQTQTDYNLKKLTCNDKSLITTQKLFLTALPKIKQLKLINNNINK